MNVQQWTVQTVHCIFLGKKRENPLTFPTLLYIVYSPSFDGESGV